MAQQERTDVVVVGGGLGGLLAAAALAKEGRRLVLLERSPRLGGRAISQRLDSGHVFNLGPHALYLGGPAMAMLDRLGVKPPGGVVRRTGNAFIRDGRLHPMPTGPISILTSGLLRSGGRMELAGALARLPRLAVQASPSQSVDAWLDSHLRHPEPRDLLRALIRLATYSAETDALSAPAALAQLSLALKGVLYVNDGWQSIVDALLRVAQQAGAVLRTRAAVEAVEEEGREVVVRTSEGDRLRADAALVVLPPRDAVELLSGGPRDELAAAVEHLRPIRAACLDLALSALPRPDRLFALGLDRPIYASVHSAFGRLAPAKGAMVQLAKYLRSGEEGASALAELETTMDLWQPGWREHVVERRFLPSMTVSWSLPTADRNGLPGRPSGVFRSAPRILLAGDWVGPRCQLLDAVASSASAAVKEALAHTQRSRVAA